MPAPERTTAPRSPRETRRRVAYVVIGVLLAVVFLGGYVLGILRNIR